MRSGDKARDGQVATSPSVLAFRCWSDWSTQSSIPDLSVPPRISWCPHSSTQPFGSLFQNHNFTFSTLPLCWLVLCIPTCSLMNTSVISAHFRGTNRRDLSITSDFQKCACAQIRPHSKAAMFPKTRKIKEACRLPSGWASSSRFLTLVFFHPRLCCLSSLPPPSLRLPGLDGTSPPGTSDLVSVTPPTQQDAAAVLPK